MARSGRTPDQRGQALQDSLVAFWVVLWLAMGVLTGFQVWSLSDLSESAAASGRAADRAGEGLQQVSDLPLIPDGVGELAASVREAATEIQQSAVDIRANVRRLSVLLGVSIAVVPIVPVVVWYVPGRTRRRRELEQVDALLRRSGRSPELDAYLALRAFHDLDYVQLLSVTPDPGGDLLAGRHEALATAQLRRLNLTGAPARRDSET